MLHLISFKLYESKSEDFDKTIKVLKDLINSDDKLIIGIKRNLISRIFDKMDKDPKELTKMLWDDHQKSYEDSKVFKSKSEFNSFVKKVLSEVKQYNKTRFKYIYKDLISQTTGKKSK